MIFVYTVTDFKINAIDCIDLLYKSIVKEKNIDFFVISNKKHTKKIKYNFLLDENETDYIGFCKYSKFIPNNYEKYVYIDSDVLFFEKISSVLSDCQFSAVKEIEHCRGNWHLHEGCNNKMIDKFPGINAGIFTYDNVNFLRKVRNLFENKIYKKNYRQLAALEQSSLNYALADECGYDFDKINDITNKVKLYAKEQVQLNKKIYHFCGDFFNEMQTKYKRMITFLRKNKIY
jgi:hypothetical protein